MTSGGVVLGDEAPILLLSVADCRLLLDELRVHARDLQERGLVDRVEQLKPLLRNLTYVRGQADLRRARFRPETTNVNCDPLGPPSEGQWLSTAQAAEVAGMSRQWMAALAKRGAIEAHRVGGRWAVSAAAVAALQDGAAS